MNATAPAEMCARPARSAHCCVQSLAPPVVARTRRDPTPQLIFTADPTLSLADLGVPRTGLLTPGPPSDFALRSLPQHGHRRKTQKLIEELQRLQLVIDEATIELAVKETMADLMTAMVISVGGRRSCPACEYLNAKELEELAIWEAENGETLERCGCGGRDATS